MFYNLVSQHWAGLSLLLAALLLFLCFYQYDRSRVGVKELTLVATLSALAALSRIPFAVVASLQPTTFMVMLSGSVFGPRIGFMIGAMAALVSNLFLGQGPWTLWQMLAWGLAGAWAGWFCLGRGRLPRLSFVFWSAFWGYAFGVIMNLWHWLGFVYPLTWQTFLATWALSFPLDSLHAAGNLFFALVFGPGLYPVLWRYKEKMAFTVVESFEAIETKPLA